MRRDLSQERLAEPRQELWVAPAAGLRRGARPKLGLPLRFRCLGERSASCLAARLGIRGLRPADPNRPRGARSWPETPQPSSPRPQGQAGRPPAARRWSACPSLYPPRAGSLPSGHVAPHRVAGDRPPQLEKWHSVVADQLPCCSRQPRGRPEGSPLTPRGNGRPTTLLAVPSLF
jgi:hypothetical protein